MTTTEHIELTGTYLLEPTHTRLGFVARQAWVSKVRGEFETFEGRAHLDDAAAHVQRLDGEGAHRIVRRRADGVADNFQTKAHVMHQTRMAFCA